MTGLLTAVQGDITQYAVDAIVNAANQTLLGGGGVDGAIHRVAGPGLLEECRALSGCATGQAKLTQGYQLPCRYIIHTVGPVWRGGSFREASLLADCYRNSLQMAIEADVTSIAFPCISTGVYRFPKVPAAEIAVSTTHDVLKNYHGILDVFFVCFSQSDLEIYQKILEGN